MPAEGIEMMNHSDILSLEEILRLAEISVQTGVGKVRLTGGEPLVRQGVLGFLKNLSAIDGIENISMTTNGFLLEEMAADLKKNGLNRLNISLDTLNREKFKKTCRVDGLEKVIKGIDSAIEAGFQPIKLNTVAVRGINDDEISDLAEFAVQKNLVLRFIEQMPFNVTDKKAYMSAAEVLAKLEKRFGKPKKIEDKRKLISAGSGPAELYHFEESGLITGFITPISNHFCGSCNRLRLTADGKLKPCLLSGHEIDIRQKLRDGSSNEMIREVLLSAICMKPEKHNINGESIRENRGMSKIGG